MSLSIGVGLSWVAAGSFASGAAIATLVNVVFVH
jgi:hypothetical protein